MEIIFPTGTLSDQKKSYRTFPVRIFIRPGVFVRYSLKKKQVLSFKSKNWRELASPVFEMGFFLESYFKRDLIIILKKFVFNELY